MAERASPTRRTESQALEFETRVGQPILRPAAELLAKGIRVEPRQKILEVGCSTGHLTALLASQIDGATQLVAVEPTASLLDLARAKIASMTMSGKKIFLKSDALTQLRFAAEVFDQCVSNLTLIDSPGREAVLAEAMRVLGPEGRFAVSAIVQGSYQEALDLYQEVCVKFDLNAHMQTADALIDRIPDAAGLRSMIEHAGVRVDRLEEQTLELVFRNGREFVQDPLFGFGVFGLLRAAAGRAPQNQRIGHHLAEAIDAYFHGGDFRMNVHLVAVFGTKLQPIEIDDDAIEEIEPA